MKRLSIIAALAAYTLFLNIATVANAMEKSNPTPGCGGGGTSDGCGQNGGGGSWGPVPIGPGPGDPSLDGSKMPRGGDDFNTKLAERKDKEAERKRKEAEKKAPPSPAGKTLGRVNTSLTPGPQHSICDAARDARARNSPAAPNLEAQCRVSKP
jgi:hypothetical protein